MENNCRICTEPAQYDIFNNELMFEQKKSVKIYIVLNNFLYEKLYAPDDFSSYICEICCENLYNSYTFMEAVRNSERQLGVEPPLKKSKGLEVTETEENKSLEVPQLDTEESIQESIPVQFEGIDDNFISEPFVEEDNDEILPEQFIEEPKLNVTKKLTKDSVSFIDYVLEHKEENDQKYVSVRVAKKAVKIRESYDFNVINHSDPETIYSCLYCIKAFANFEMLIKHVTQCHVCMTCMKISPTYNDLNEHIKNDHADKLCCPFCLKQSFNQKSIRPHIKKFHITNLPNYYSVLIE